MALSEMIGTMQQRGERGAKQFRHGDRGPRPQQPGRPCGVAVAGGDVLTVDQRLHQCVEPCEQSLRGRPVADWQKLKA